MFTNSSFGPYRCGENLVRILNESDDPKLNRKSMRYISENFQLIKSISEIVDPKHRRAIAGMFRKNIRDNFKMDVPEKIKTHLQNIVITHLKSYMDQSSYYDDCV